MFTHSTYSLRYGILKSDELIPLMQELGYSAFALADINTTSAVLQSLRMAKEYDIHIAPGIDFRNGMECCFVCIAQNNRGFHEMNEFLTKHLHHDIPFPEEAPHLGNCSIIYPFNKIPKRALRSNEFIGIELHDLPKIVRQKNQSWFKKAVLLSFMTFRNKQDFNTHRLLRAVDENCLLSKLDPTKQTSENEMFISKDELYAYFKNEPEILQRTEQLLRDAYVDFKFGSEATSQNIISYTGAIQTDLELIKKLAYEGARKRFKQITPIIENRIAHEIDLIHQKGFLSYFLITWDIVNYARTKNYFHVGRGSGANSLVAYLLYITNVDPLELDLYFERFINLYRSSPPDFDIDFSWRDRDDVIEYIFNRYPQAALLATYNTFQYKAAIRELGKVMGMPKSEIDLLTTRQSEPEDQIARLVMRYSQRITGLPNHLSIHAGGIIIPEKPITWYTPTFMPPKGFPTTQFSMLEAEDVGLYKFDILSQRGLGKIRDCIEIIHHNQPDNPPHDIHDVQHFIQDEKVKNLLRNAETNGCFYVESPAMRNLIKKLEVDDYLGVVAASSIIRPGVSGSGMMDEYIKRHREPERRKNIHPVMQEIMPETYGVMVYQEDVLKVAHHFAGLNLGEADILRRAMSGKFRSKAEFQKLKDTFFEKCAERGHSINMTHEVWNQIESFAGYAFSKGHSASYAVESYQCMYLKAYYPIEFLLASLTNFGGFYSVETYIHEAKRYGAIIESPCVNQGKYQSSIQGKTIYLGFNLVKEIEDKVAIQIEQERWKNGIFKDLNHFLKRVEISLEQINLLVRIGAFRSFGLQKKELLWQVQFYFHGKKKNSPQLVIFDEKPKQFKLPKLQELFAEQAFEELELLGFPLCNPFDLLKEKAPSVVHPHEYLEKNKGLKIVRYGYLVTARRVRTKNNDNMYFGMFTDQEGHYFDTVHFPESAHKFPFRGMGIYQIIGVVSEAYGVYHIEVGSMHKMVWVDDPRYGDG
jgi:DNA-directed DNA polymerase III PolC